MVKTSVLSKAVGGSFDTQVYHGVDCTRIAVDSRFQGMEARDVVTSGRQDPKPSVSKGVFLVRVELRNPWLIIQNHDIFSNVITKI